MINSKTVASKIRFFISFRIAAIQCSAYKPLLPHGGNVVPFAEMGCAIPLWEVVDASTNDLRFHFISAHSLHNVPCPRKRLYRNRYREEPRLSRYSRPSYN